MSAPEQGGGAAHARVERGLARLPVVARVREALRPGEPAWAVGGAVRDVLLGRTPAELDVVVLEDPAGLAARLAGDVRAHERFGTARVGTPDGVVDLARARTERYPRPGALPEVAFAGDLLADLPRRDVTVGAIAHGLHDGATVAVPGALADLDARVLRVLHEASLRDDPTRAWRLARYAARLGFGVDPATAALAAAADPSTVSADRHRAELDLLLAEPDPGAAFAQLAALAPAFLPAGFVTRPDGLDAALELLGDEGRPGLVRLAAHGAGVDARALAAWLEGVGVAPAERTVVGAAAREAVLAPLRTATSPSAIRRAARGAPVEVVARAGGPSARRWLRELRHVRLAIDGDDLLAAGVPRGPEVGRRLEAALEARLDGRLDPALPRREAELAAALA